MRHAWKILVVIPMAIGLSAPATSGKTDGIELSDRQQKKFDARLKGRTAGKPVSCLSRQEQKYMSVISDDIIVFGTGRSANTLYVNKPNGGCRRAESHSLVTQSNSSRLCQGEIAEVKDLRSNSFIGTCTWNKFVPYTKAK